MHTRSINTFGSLSIFSAGYGAALGFILGSLYLVYIMIRVAVVDVSASPTIPLPFTIIFLIITGTIFGIVPSIFLGTITALCISAALWYLRKWLSAILSVGIGVAICNGFVLLVRYASDHAMNMATGRVSFVGVAAHFWTNTPTLIYFLAGSYMAWKCFKLLAKKRNDENSRAESIVDTIHS